MLRPVPSGRRPADVQEVALARTTRGRRVAVRAERAAGRRCSGSSRVASTRAPAPARRGDHEARLRWSRARRARGRRARRGHLSRARRGRAHAARRSAALPDGRRHARPIWSAGSRPASTCSIASCRPATRATATCSRRRQGQHPERRATARTSVPIDPDLPVCDVPDALPRLPATSLHGQGDPVLAPRNPAQPHVLRSPRARAPRPDPGGGSACLTRCSAGCYATAGFSRYLARGVSQESAMQAMQPIMLMLVMFGIFYSS